MGCGGCKTEKKVELVLDDAQKGILLALKGMKKPLGCKEIAEKAGLATASVTGKIRGLKTKGLVESLAEGKYLLTETGKKEAAKKPKAVKAPAPVKVAAKKPAPAKKVVAAKKPAPAKKVVAVKKPAPAKKVVAVKKAKAPKK